MIKLANSDILKIFLNLNPNKAHGHDQISNRMLKICGKKYSYLKILIFNNFLASGFFSSDWKKGNIVPALKKNGIPH